MVSFSTRSLDATPQEAAAGRYRFRRSAFAERCKGIKTGQEGKSLSRWSRKWPSRSRWQDDAVGKIDDKEVAGDRGCRADAEAGRRRRRSPIRRSRRRKEAGSRKSRSRRSRTRSRRSIQIAEALKKEEAKKPVEKKQAKVEPKKEEKPKKHEKPKKERTFDQSKIAALLDKRDPSRQSTAGAAMNNTLVVRYIDRAGRSG
jgi:hypothetical protein